MNEPSSAPASQFHRLHPRLREAIVARLGWTALRPVQELSTEAILAGHNAVVLAPTAGGKTEAAVFATLSLLLDEPPSAVGALYIAPIKALLNNQSERLGQYTEMVGLRRFVWHGDVEAGAKRGFTKEPCELLMTTPESLEVLLLSSKAKPDELFRDLRVVIIDEVHALAGTDRGAHLLSVLERVKRRSRFDLQRVGLSATVGNPERILRWLQGSSTRPGALVDPPRAKSKRELQVWMQPSVGQLAETCASMGAAKKSLVFCQSRAATEVLASRMRTEGIDVFVHHGSVAAEERQAAEERFARGKNTAIVCTSTLELGIDVGDLDRVFQLGAPSTVSSFLQRMGRTGRRAGTVANTTFLCEDGDEVLQCAAIVELARKGWVEPVNPSERCWPVLLHQLFVMALERKGVTASAAWEQLSVVPDFRGITKNEFDALVEHLLRRDYLFDASGRLVLGIAAEREFGKKNFMEIYAVFSSPVHFAVRTTTGQELGSIEQGFADRLSPKVTAFLLAGRAWLVESVDLKKREVIVTAAPAGTKPSWGGRVPQLLGFDVARAMREVLRSDEALSYLRPEAMAELTLLREERRATLSHGGPSIVYEPGSARWWTWSGGKVNATLAYALTLRGGWKCHWDNTGVRIDGDGLQWSTLSPVLRELERFSFWEDEEVWKELLAKLPEYRLSKFQRAMPERAAREMIGEYLLDWERARECARGG